MSNYYLPWTQQTQEVLRHALDEVQRYNRTAIGTEHVLLGLAKQFRSDAARILRAYGGEKDAIRKAIEVLYDQVTTLQSPSFFDGLTHTACAIAEDYHHTALHTEHFLLALTQTQRGMHIQVLEYLGIDLNDFRQTVGQHLALHLDQYTVDVLDDIPSSTVGLGMPGIGREMIPVIQSAYDESNRLNQHCIDAGHLLFGLLHEQSGPTAQVLQETVDDLEGTRIYLHMFLAQQQYSLNEQGITADVRRLMSYSKEEARQRNSSSVRPEHVLLGLTRASYNSSITILQDLGINRDQLLMGGIALKMERRKALMRGTYRINAV